MDVLDKKINEVFQGKAVRKDLTALLKRTANVPAYVIEFLLGMYANTTDDDTLRDGLDNIRRILSENYVRPDEGEKIKSRIRENGEYTVIDKITAKFNERKDIYTGTFSNLDTEPFLLPYEYIKGYEKMLTSGVWCISRMAYEQNGEYSFRIVSLKPVQMPALDLSEITSVRKEFSYEEWRDLLLRSAGYEPSALTDIECLHLIERMVPLAERNYNLCELGPKGTGKSHIYKEISPYSILTSSGNITTANLFVNMNSGQLGLAGYWDCVALDEVSGMHLRNKETIQVLKDYMASGSYPGKNDMVNADASLVMIGNANLSTSESSSDSGTHLFSAFPPVLRNDSALFDRVHYILSGADVPKLRPELLTDHYGLNTDYLSEFFREMRKKDYGHIFEEVYKLNYDFNQRDVIAVRKTFSGLSKLLFPDMVMSEDDMKMILEYSIAGRKRVKEQLKVMDGAEFGAVNLGYFDDSGKEVVVELLEKDASDSGRSDNHGQWIPDQVRDDTGGQRDDNFGEKNSTAGYRNDVGGDKDEFIIGFSELIKDYPDSLLNRQKFSAIMKDIFPTQGMSANIMIALYDLGIRVGIDKSELLDRTFVHRFAKQLTVEYGIMPENADWAASVWCVVYGKEYLGKQCEVEIPVIDYVKDEEDGLLPVSDEDIENAPPEKPKSPEAKRIENKMRESFMDDGEVVVLKNAERTEFFRKMGLPSFMRDWITMQFSDQTGRFNKTAALKYISRVVPKRDDFENIKYRLNKGETVRILARVRITINITTGNTEFELPDFEGKRNGAAGIVEKNVVDKWAGVLLRESENWGVIDLLREEEEEGKKLRGVLKLVGYERFSVYDIDLDKYRAHRKLFSIDEWINILLTAVDYNPDGYKDENQKLYFLRRLLPFVQRNINLIELAPKGTGKTYVYQTISKRGWLQAAGTVSRSSLLYNNNTREPGLLMHFDFVVFDEIQTMVFKDPLEIQSALKHYMEFGEIKGFDTQMTSDAGIVLLGNIEESKWNIEANMMTEINSVFRESATLDRFHGFIEGWEIPRMGHELIADGWALSTEYFTEVLHMLRGDMSYAAIVSECLDVPKKADQRDLTAIKRLTEAFLKLLYPHVQSKDDITPDEFIQYCLEPAKEMRRIIKKQLAIIDPGEFDVPEKRDIPDIKYRY